MGAGQLLMIFHALLVCWAQEAEVALGVLRLPLSRFRPRATASFICQMSLPPNFGRIKACTECRQVKLGCNARERFPAPCSRCLQRKLPCRLDRHFKRVAMRGFVTVAASPSLSSADWCRRLEKVTSELESLRGIVANESTARAARTTPTTTAATTPVTMPPSLQPLFTSPASCSSPTLSASLRVPLSDSDSASSLSASPPWLRFGDEPDDGEWVLDQCCLSTADVFELFRYFDAVFYPQFPVLAPITSPRRLYRNSPLLFWTIIEIAMRNHAILSRRAQYLVEPYFNSLLIPVFKFAIHDITVIQSLLLFCNWPLPQKFMREDPSWNFSSAALSAAMQIGIHLVPLQMARIGGIDETLSPAEAADMCRRTWVACFVVNARLSCFIGITPQLQNLAHITRISRFSTTLPSRLRAEGIIMARYAQCVGPLECACDDRNRPMLVSLIFQFVHEFTDLRESPLLRDCDGDMVDNLIEACCLNILSFVFTQLRDDEAAEMSARGGGSSASDDEGFRIAFRTILQEGLRCSAKLALNLKSQSDTLQRIALSHHPLPTSNNTWTAIRACSFLAGPYYVASFLAALFLLKYLALSPRTQLADQAYAVKNITMVHQVFRAALGSRKLQRAALALEILGRIARSGDVFKVTRVTTRLSASIIYDGIKLIMDFKTKNCVDDGSSVEQEGRRPLLDVLRRVSEDEPVAGTKPVAGTEAVDGLSLLAQTSMTTSHYVEHVPPSLPPPMVPSPPLLVPAPNVPAPTSMDIPYWDETLDDMFMQFDTGWTWDDWDLAELDISI
ncbi:uncharacterized protein V1518DRAFT_452498 [Limtongia smithiae]|uniref:uncharacterized protein n=1 Tax=Limtongia smithiae TaxID=1125753 RepID=UPI0034D00301